METAQRLGAEPVLSSTKLAELASAAGFDLCGFARAEPIEPAFLLGWLEAGMAAEMDWMHDRVAERLDVSLLLPGAKTVVALACNYFQPDASAASAIARYARGRDYHYTLKDRLRNLRRSLLTHHPKVKTYTSVDSTPVMEKVWAARAGLGYVGRNGCFITEPFGSYVLLAIFILDVEVDSYGAGPSPDRCAHCRLCITACPTEAIVADAVVDARACLSYQTIENRSAPIPESLRSSMADLAFGCDICQDVCPLNVSPVPASARFLPREGGLKNALELAAMTPEQYQAWVPGTPLARAKYDGLRRNAAYALGASKVPAARPVLERLATDASALVRNAALWALKRLDEEEVANGSKQP